MTLNEALVQSVSAEPGQPEVIRVFPAWPETWDAAFRLLIRGGFLVSASMRAGLVEFVEIESRVGEPCRMRNPWDKPCRVQQADGPTLHLVDEILHFETKPGARYLVLPEGAEIPEARRITAEPANRSRLLPVHSSRRNHRWWHSRPTMSASVPSPLTGTDRCACSTAD